MWAPRILVIVLANFAINYLYLRRPTDSVGEEAAKPARRNERTRLAEIG